MKRPRDDRGTCARLAQIAEAGLQPRKKCSFKIGFIVPPSPFVVPNGWEFVHTAPFEGPSVIAAVFKGLGCDVTLLDQRENFDPEALAGGALRAFDLIAVATYEDSFPFLRRVVAIAKKEAPSRPVVLGGPLVTSVPKLILTHTDADYAVVGEGELTTIELMDFLMRQRGAQRPARIRGLAWKESDGEVRMNPRRPQMDTLDIVPLQDFSVWPRVLRTGQAREIYISSSRGCPGACRFCFRAMPALRHKSPRRVRRELLALKRYGYRFAWWNDLTFIDVKARVCRLMDEALRGIDFRWCCFSRVDGVDPAVLRRMKERGCDIVLYGFESITKEILDYFRKKVSQHQIVRAITLTKQAGLKVGGLFIVGGPGETNESLKRTIAFCRRFKEVTRVKYMSALPGTPLYYDALKKGIIKDELEHLYFLARERSVEDDEILNFTDVSEADLRAAYRAINRQIEVRPYAYNNPNNRYLKRPRPFKRRAFMAAS